MHMPRIFHLFLLITIAIFPTGLRADMHFTTDPVSGLDWLDLSETANMAYNDAPTSFPGWRYATNSEIEALFSTWFPAFVPYPTTGSADSFFSPYPGINDEARGFIEAFGPGYDDGSWLWAVGVYKDENDTLRPLGALAHPDYSQSQVLGPEYVNLPIVGTDINPQYGIFLVRGSTGGPTDTTDPTLVSVTIDPDTISTLNGQVEVNIDVSATDSESGVNHIEIFLDDPLSNDPAQRIGQSWSAAPAPAEQSVNQTFTVMFPQNSSEGMWQLSGEVRDDANNVTTFSGGSGGVPEGVLVYQSLCLPGEVEARKGPYETVQFGQSVDPNAVYTFVINAASIRGIQRDMNDYAGWDTELRAIDYAIYYTYCEMKRLKKLIKEGQDLQAQYDTHKETIEELIDNDMYIKIEQLKIYIQAIQTELGLSHYQELLDLMTRSNIRTESRNIKGKEFADVMGLASFFDTVRDYLRAGAVGSTAKVGILGIVGTLYDLYNISVDYPDLYEIIFDENPTFDQWGSSFTELWSMAIELQILLDQYESQRDEYQKLQKKL